MQEFRIGKIVELAFFLFAFFFFCVCVFVWVFLINLITPHYKIHFQIHTEFAVFIFVFASLEGELYF